MGNRSYKNTGVNVGAPTGDAGRRPLARRESAGGGGHCLPRSQVKRGALWTRDAGSGLGEAGSLCCS